jgi:hypothetical protein
MNLTEKLALDCAVKISKPFIDRFFFPIESEKFIIFDTRCRYPFGTYDFYEDVLNIISKYLKQNKIQVFQFASDNSYKIAGDKCFIKLNKKQEAYLISKSELLIANENYSLHTASVLNKKSIGLYSIFDPKNTAPIWNKSNQTIIESSRYGNKPSFNQLKEIPKTINAINPYEVASNILKSLNIKNDLKKYKLLHIGQNYNQKIVEIVPDFTSQKDFLAGSSINLRLDLIDNLKMDIFQYWMSNKKVNIITDQDLHTGLLKNFKSSILSLTIMVSDKISETFLKACQSLGLKIKIYCADKDKINDFRFKFLDWDIKADYNEDLRLEKIENIKETSKFESSKIIFSKGKKYSSKASFLQEKPLDSNGNNVILNKEFEEELDYFKIYDELPTKKK